MVVNQALSRCEHVECAPAWGLASARSVVGGIAARRRIYIYIYIYIDICIWNPVYPYGLPKPY